MNREPIYIGVREGHIEPGYWILRDSVLRELRYTHPVKVTEIRGQMIIFMAPTQVDATMTPDITGRCMRHTVRVVCKTEEDARAVYAKARAAYEGVNAARDAGNAALDLFLVQLVDERPV